MRDIWVQLETAEGRVCLVRPDEVAMLEATASEHGELTQLILAGAAFTNVVKGTPRKIANKLHEALHGDSVGQPAPAAPAPEPSGERDTEPPPAKDAADDLVDGHDENELDAATAELAAELADESKTDAAE